MPGYCAALAFAAELAPAVVAPPNPAAAYRASMPPPVGGMIGVSGGGGDPLCARVVMTEAVESILPIPAPPGFGMLSPPGFAGCALPPADGGGQYCWW